MTAEFCSWCGTHATPECPLAIWLLADGYSVGLCRNCAARVDMDLYIKERKEQQ